MDHTPTPTEASATDAPALSDAQVHYFETFGYLRLPGWFVHDIDEIATAFDEVFARDDVMRLETHEQVHFGGRRETIAYFVDQSPRLAVLRSDPRITGVVDALLGPDWEYGESDGNHFFCETSWHNDMYGADLRRRNIKLTFYLEPLTAANGAIRLIPGSHHTGERFAKMLHRRTRAPGRIPKVLGVEPRDVPAWVVETVPGDLMVWDYGLRHASFGSHERRRLFTMNFSAARPTAG